MISMIKDSYMLFFKKLPLWIAILLPLVIFSYTDEYIRATYGYSWAMRLGGVAVVALIELLVFKFAAEIKLGNVWQVVKKIFLISIYQVIIGGIMIMPIFIFMKIAIHHHALSVGFLFFSFAVNIFLGGYIFAKYNVLLPLIAGEKKIFSSQLKQYVQGSYKDWCLVSFLLYFPYVCSLLLINCTLTSIVISSIFVVVFSIFNALYYNLRK